MGKNKKKKAQMFSNFLAFKAGQGSQNADNRTDVGIVNKPNLPTVVGQSLPARAGAAHFQTPHADPHALAELLDDSSPPAPPAPAAPAAPPAPLSTHQSGAGRWRPVPDAAGIQLNIRTDPKRPNLTVVEGSASGIQLGLHRSERGASRELRLKLESQEELPQQAVMSAVAAAGGKRRAPHWVLAAPSPPPAKQPAPAPAPAPAPLHNVGSGWPRSMSARSPAVAPPAAAPPAPAAPLRVRTASPESAAEAPPPQPYSPSDVYSEAMFNEEVEEPGAGVGAESRRVSAFQRLGPAPAAAEAEAAAQVAASTHEVVVQYREQWPHRPPLVPVRVASARTSKSAMLLQTEYMEETYSRDNRFVLVTVTGFPESWSREDVLDAILESVKGKSFIPCFIEMSGGECRFLVVRCRAALLHIHKYGFVVRGAGAGAEAGAGELVVALGCVQLTLAQLDFVPRLVLRRLAQLRLHGTRLDLSRFTRAPDVGQFVYFPLWRAANQAELVQLPDAAPWPRLTHLDLSHNRITSLSGLELGATCPRLRSLDLAHNRLASVTALLCARALPLRALVLEGNPLCRDYIRPERYLAALALLFPALQAVDGVAVRRRGALPPPARRYSASQRGAELAERLLAALLPPLALARDSAARADAALLYHERATLSVTLGPRLREWGAAAPGALLRCGALRGRAEIARALQRWPALQHAPATLTLDVMHHDETTTVLVVGGLARAEGEGQVFAFSRAVVLRAPPAPRAAAVVAELLHWEVPARAQRAALPDFDQIKAHNYPSLDDPPDEELKQKLLTVFMQITELDKRPSERCLEAKDWNIKNALEYFVSLLKLDHLEPIMKD